MVSYCSTVTLSIRRIDFEILDFKNAMKTGLGVHQGHWKCHHSIERIWLAMCRFLYIHLVKKYCDFEFRVRGHSRSLKVVPFDRLVMVSYWYIVTLSPKSTVFEKNGVTLKFRSKVTGTDMDMPPMTSYYIVTMGLSRIVSEIDGDFRLRKSQIFPTPMYIMPPAEGVNQAINQSINQSVLFQATIKAHTWKATKRENT